MSEIPSRELRGNARRVGALRSTLIGYGVLAFTFFPPTRTLMLCGVLVQIVAIIARWLIERRLREPEQATQSLTIVELLADGVTVALFAIATLGGIMQFGDQI